MSRIEVIKLSPEQWRKDFSEAAHLAAFKETSDPDEEHISFALLAIVDGKAAAYLTAREIGGGALYLAYGGAFKPIRETVGTLPVYLKLIEECLKVSDYLTTYVDNKNTGYLKLAFRAGFLITGIRTYKRDTLVELTIDRSI